MEGVKLEDNKYNAEIIVRPVPVDVAPQQLVSVRGMGGQYSRTEIDDLCGLDTRVVVFIAPGCPEESLPHNSFQIREFGKDYLRDFLMSRRLQVCRPVKPVCSNIVTLVGLGAVVFCIIKYPGAICLPYY
ncbi:hypothetical protein Pelo_8009 [Pelomyxa schiedti]|nr:hypothetical protein Pelo_8009 [Pelomyxa schiedti]